MRYQRKTLVALGLDRSIKGTEFKVVEIKICKSSPFTVNAQMSLKFCCC